MKRKHEAEKELNDKAIAEQRAKTAKFVEQQRALEKAELEKAQK